MKNTSKIFLIVNNLIVIGALIAARFEIHAIYITLFAISVAYQISTLRR